MQSILPTDVRDMLQEFYEALIVEYPEYKKYSLAQVSEACRASFSFIKAKMRDRDLPSIRVPHLGLFEVKPGKALGQLRMYEKALEKENPEDERKIMEDKVIMLTQYLKTHAPHKLRQGPRQPGEYTGIFNRELEVPPLLQPEPSPEETPEDPYSRANWFSHFFNG